MNRKVIILLLFSLTILAFCDNKQNIVSKDVYDRLCGVWSTSPREKIDESFLGEEDFSWGKSKIEVNSSQIIDLGATPPKLELVGFGSIFIKEIIKQTKDIIIMNAVYPKEKKECQYIIHLNEGGTIWFEKAPFIAESLIGPDVIYYKISGPGIK